MLRTRTLLAAGVALALWSLAVRAQDDDARVLVIQAMKAHGGKEPLKKYQGAQVKYKGEVDAMGITAKVEGEVFYNFPDRMKNVINVDSQRHEDPGPAGLRRQGPVDQRHGHDQELKDEEQDRGDEGRACTPSRSPASSTSTPRSTSCRRSAR